MMYFLRVDGEVCYHKRSLNEMDAEELLAIGAMVYYEDNEPVAYAAYVAKPIIGQGYFYCTLYSTAGEVSSSDCGTGCVGYSPRNGKAGRCKYSGYCYEPTEKVIIKFKKMQCREYDRNAAGKLKAQA